MSTSVFMLKTVKGLEETILEFKNLPGCPPVVRAQCLGILAPPSCHRGSPLADAQAAAVYLGGGSWGHAAGGPMEEDLEASIGWQKGRDMHACIIHDTYDINAYLARRLRVGGTRWRMECEGKLPPELIACDRYETGYDNDRICFLPLITKKGWTRHCLLERGTNSLDNNIFPTCLAPGAQEGLMEARKNGTEAQLGWFILNCTCSHGEAKKQ